MIQDIGQRQRTPRHDHRDNRHTRVPHPADELGLAPGQADVGATMRLTGQDGFFTEHQHRDVRLPGHGNGFVETLGRLRSRRLHRANETDLDVVARLLADAVECRDAPIRHAVEYPRTELLIRVIGERADDGNGVCRRLVERAASAAHFLSSTRPFQAPRLSQPANAGRRNRRVSKSAGSVNGRSNSPSFSFACSISETLWSISASSIRPSPTSCFQVI